tara:strand:- start:92 stop:238 length:147 start_codon:yes stop_codon:yes gene_type:complete
MVDRKEKGLHCTAGGHRICWKCMSDEIDWAQVVMDLQTAGEDWQGGYP